MGNVDDAFPLPAQPVNDLHQDIDFFLIQRGSRLVQRDDIAVVGDCLRDVHHLALGDRQAGKPGAGVDLDLAAQGCQHSLGVFYHLSGVDQAKLFGKAPQPDIFHHAALRDLFQFLVDHRDAVKQCLVRRLEIDLLPAQLDGALVLVVNAEQAFHQSRLAGTVFAHQCMDCAGAHIEIYPFERLHTGKCFGNAAHFQQVFLRSRCSGLFLLCRTHFSAPFWVFFLPFLLFCLIFGYKSSAKQPSVCRSTLRSMKFQSDGCAVRITCRLRSRPARSSGSP